MDQPAAEQLDPRQDHQPVQQQDPLRESVAPLGFRPDQWQVRSHPPVPHQWQAPHRPLAEYRPKVQRPPWSPRPLVQQ